MLQTRIKNRLIRRGIVILALLAVLLGIPVAAGQTFEAVRWYRLAAEQGDATAQYNLGLMYATGEGVPEDHAEAAKWFRLAAEQGDAAHQRRLGFVYATGEGVPEDHAEAAKWYRLAAEQGDAAHQRRLGFVYATGEGVPEDHAEAAKWYRLAAEQGDAGAPASTSGSCTPPARVCRRTMPKPMKWYRDWLPSKATLARRPTSGSMYANGRGCARRTMPKR